MFRRARQTGQATESRIQLTRQRRVILEELAKVTSHPTAAQVYEMVRSRLPRIGVATVYRNLELMARNGLLLKLEISGGRNRFDATTTPHYHIRCSSCGKVDDLDIPVDETLEAGAAQGTNYSILGHTVEFRGICPDCRRKEKTLQ